jgi:HSP20 family molecular chaperone IbpA
MNIFNQIAPRFTRAFSRNGENATNLQEQEFALKPAHEIQESADAWNLTVQLPGVSKEGLTLSVDDTQVTVRGQRAWRKPEGWTQLHRESADVAYELVLEHDNAVNAEKVSAELRDGVLRVSLPKAEALKPRKIAIN